MEVPALRVPLQQVAKTAPYNGHSKAVVEMLTAVTVVLEVHAQQIASLTAELEALSARLASVTPPTGD